MNYLKNIIRRILGNKNRNISAKNAYNLLAPYYDLKQDNIIPILDQLLVKQLLCDMTIKVENGLDYGAGTGRNIPLLNSLITKNIFAYDISKEMEKILIKKYPEVIIVCKKGKQKLNIPDGSINLIFCNLCIGYIKNVESLFKEWNRILHKEGFLILTDIHSELLLNGHRNFEYNGSNLYIDHFKHETQYFEKLFEKCNWDITLFKELTIDDRVFEIFRNRQESYEVLKNKKVLFGYLLRKVSVHRSN